MDEKTARENLGLPLVGAITRKEINDAYLSEFDKAKGENELMEKIA